MKITIDIYDSSSPISVDFSLFLRLRERRRNRPDAGLHFDSSSSVTLAGAPLSGQVSAHQTMLQPRLNWIIIFYLNVSASLTVGIPSVSRVGGDRSACAIGRPGDVRLASRRFSVEYDFTEWGARHLLVAASKMRRPQRLGLYHVTTNPRLMDCVPATDRLSGGLARFANDTTTHRSIQEKLRPRPVSAVARGRSASLASPCVVVITNPYSEGLSFSVGQAGRRGVARAKA